MPFLGCNEKRRVPLLILKVHFTATSNELFYDVRMSFRSSDVERRCPICLQRKIDVAVSFNQLPRDGRMPILGRNEERGGPICRLVKIDVGVSGDELLYDKSIPLGDCFVERCASIYVSVVDVRLHS